jgi:hypothetical protein
MLIVASQYSSSRRPQRYGFLINFLKSFAIKRGGRAATRVKRGVPQ